MFTHSFFANLHQQWARNHQYVNILKVLIFEKIHCNLTVDTHLIGTKGRKYKITVINDEKNFYSINQ